MKWSVRDFGWNLRREDVTAVVSDQEVHPVDLWPYQVLTRPLAPADYSLLGQEDRLAVVRMFFVELERQVHSFLPDFEREVHKLSKFQIGLIVVEETPRADFAYEWEQQTRFERVSKGVQQLKQRYRVPFLLAHDRFQATDMIRRILWAAAATRFKELQKFVWLVGGGQTYSTARSTYTTTTATATTTTCAA